MFAWPRYRCFNGLGCEVSSLQGRLRESPVWRHVGAVGILGVLATAPAALSVWAQVLLAGVIGRMLTLSLSSLVSQLVSLAEVTLAVMAFNLIASVYTPRITVTLITELRNAVHERVAFADLPGALGDAGEVITRIATDIPTYVQNNLSIVTTTTSAAATLVAIAAVGLRLDPALLAVWVGTVPLYYVVPALFRTPLRRLGERSREAWGLATSDLFSVTQGADTLKLSAT